jgi:hypothetical protein
MLVSCEVQQTILCRKDFCALGRALWYLKQRVFAQTAQVLTIMACMLCSVQAARVKETLAEFSCMLVVFASVCLLELLADGLSLLICVLWYDSCELWYQITVKKLAQ